MFSDSYGALPSEDYADYALPPSDSYGAASDDASVAIPDNYGAAPADVAAPLPSWVAPHGGATRERSDGNEDESEQREWGGGGGGVTKVQNIFLINFLAKSGNSKHFSFFSFFSKKK